MNSSFFGTAVLALLLSVVVEASCPAASIETVLVGNSGNAPDTGSGLGGAFGDVADDFRIGTFEVTNQQYADFLNAVARSDPHGLYNEEMGQNERGGITRAASDVGFVYSTRPVSYTHLTLPTKA